MYYNFFTYFRFPGGNGWFHIYKAEDADNVWAPELTFPNIIDSKMLNNYGKGQREFDFWYGTKSEKMQFIKSMKLRLTCPFRFENYVS